MIDGDVWMVEAIRRKNIRGYRHFPPLGLEPGFPLAYFIGGLELFGGLAVAAGFLARPFATMLFGELLVIPVTVMISCCTNYQLSVVCWGHSYSSRYVVAGAFCWI